MEPPAGIEPATSRLQGECSGQLSYRGVLLARQHSDCHPGQRVRRTPGAAVTSRIRPGRCRPVTLSHAAWRLMTVRAHLTESAVTRVRHVLAAREAQITVQGTDGHHTGVPAPTSPPVLAGAAWRRSLLPLGSSGTFLPVKGSTPSWRRSPSTRRPGSTRAPSAPPSTSSTSRSTTASSSSSSAPPAAASPPACACSPASRTSTTGAICIDDRDVTHLPPKARDIAMVFQNYALYPHMTVYENMAFALKLRKTSKARSTGGSRRRRRCSSSRSTSAASRRRSPAVSASGSRWAGRSSASRRSSSWTSRCRTSTRSCACRPVRRSPRCRPSSASPPSTSPTTRSRR